MKNILKFDEIKLITGGNHCYMCVCQKNTAMINERSISIDNINNKQLFNIGNRIYRSNKNKTAFSNNVYIVSEFALSASGFGNVCTKVCGYQFVNGYREVDSIYCEQ